jgi:hypothetical protein
MGHTYPWVDPLRTSHPKFFKPIQLQNNIGITLKKKGFHSKLFIKSLPSRVEFKTLIKFTRKCVLMWKMNA